jgi:alpha-beta hydrolase superfamily lysophospholipase
VKVLFENPLFDGQFLRLLGHIYYGGADIGECVATARSITEGDFESWHAGWKATAERVYDTAQASRDRGHPVSAREAYLRAASYFRASFIFLYGSPVDPRLVEAFDRQAEAFRQAAARLPFPAEPVAIPYEGTTLPGYFYRVDESGAPRPTLITMGGYDSTVEEQYFFGAAAALRRGYNCLSFDGPGQGEPLIHRGLPIRPDWENVVRPVVDYALTRPEVDPERLALLGTSFGGYLAPRAAAGEPRLRACIADPGQYDLGEAVRSRLPLPPEERDRFPDLDPEILEPVVAGMLANPAAAWSLRRSMWVHGVDDLVSLVRVMGSFTVAGRAERIACPTLVCQAESDPIAAQAGQLYAALTSPKQFLRFTEAEGAGDHCEQGAHALFHQRMFDWLDEVFVGEGKRG